MPDMDFAGNGFQINDRAFIPAIKAVAARTAHRRLLGNVDLLHLLRQGQPTFSDKEKSFSVLFMFAP
jgi:hypothetical protein